MNNKKPTGSKEPNIVLDIHTELSRFPVMFRERVCEGCNWSTPTFYRKMRFYDSRSVTDKTKMVSVISNAEKQKIMEVLEEGFIKVAEKCQKYMKNIHISQNNAAR